MSDFFNDRVDNEKDDVNGEPAVEITPNIELQLNKFNDGEYLKEKYIPEKALFASESIIKTLKTFYINNIDIPLIIYGNKGIGKTTCIFGLLEYIPCYLPDGECNSNGNSNGNSNSNTNGLDNLLENKIEKKLETKITKITKISKITKINNIKYFKVLDNEFSKLIYYENIYYLNIKVLHNNTEILNYLEYIYKITRTRSFDEGEKKIIIISNIDKCNSEAQRYIAFMIEKISNQSAYIFTTHKITVLDKKITSSCSHFLYNHLDETAFCKIFLYNFKNIFKTNKTYLYPSNLKHYYQIYISNKYNIGTTIAQIKYYLETEGINFLKDKTKLCSLMTTIAKNFIKKKLILSTVNSTLEIRKFLYIMVSLNINLITFVQEVVNQLSKSHLNTNIKLEIIDQVRHLTKDILDSNKEVILIETFFYNIINIIYSTEKNISK
jgi:hypothetical protein